MCYENSEKRGEISNEDLRKNWDMIVFTYLKLRLQTPIQGEMHNDY